MKKRNVLSVTVCISLAICYLLTFLVALDSAEGASPPANQSKPRYGGTLRLSQQQDGTRVGYPPKMGPTPYSLKMVAPVIETLLRVDKTGKVIPWLATGFKEDPKAKTITLTLRKGIKFHDGTDFNAEAVKWNLEQARDAKLTGSLEFKAIDRVDDYTVRINLDDWDSTVTANLTQYAGMMISPTAAKKNGPDWAAAHPVGTGPFEFVSWEKDIRAVFKKFPNYWQKGKPYLDEIVWIPIADSNTRFMSFKAGELDAQVTMDLKHLEEAKKLGYPVSSSGGSGAIGFVFDSANPKSPFADIRVRQAVQYAIDPQAIAKGVLYGQVEPTNQWSYKGHWSYNPSVVGYPYNPAKAKALLKQAGFPNGFKTKIGYRVAIGLRLSCKATSRL